VEGRATAGAFFYVTKKRTHPPSVGLAFYVVGRHAYVEKAPKSENAWGRDREKWQLLEQFDFADIRSFTQHQLG